MSLGTVNNLRLEASNAVESAVESAKYTSKTPVVGADETSFAQGNVDGCNDKKSRLWVAVTPLVTYFQIALSVVPDTMWSWVKLCGILNSDR